jgi:hypothetical protein
MRGVRSQSPCAGAYMHVCSAVVSGRTDQVRLGRRHTSSRTCLNSVGNVRVFCTSVCTHRYLPIPMPLAGEWMKRLRKLKH